MRAQRVIVYRATYGWSWALYAGNGRAIGASWESYRRRAAALRNFIEVTGRVPWDDYPPRGTFWSRT